MKKMLHSISLVSGFVLLLGGLLLYALHKHGSLTLAMEKLPLVAGILGIGLIVGGSCQLFIQQTKEAQIEAKDERNIAIAKTAKAFGFDMMTVLFSAVIVILMLADLITATAFFTLVAMFALCQIAFVYKLWSLQKKM